MGTDYEQFVQSVYQTILLAEGIDTLNVQHNVVVEGKSGCSHQIDIFWEFEVAGEIYATAIECKCYNSSVSIGKIRDFYGVLVDIPKLNGIFATTKGFQAGAKTYADHYGIDLKEIREPNAADWDGRVKDIELNLHVRNMTVTSWQPLPTGEYFDSVPNGEEVQITTGFRTDEPIVFKDEDGSSLSRNDLDDLVPFDYEAGAGFEYFVDLPGHTLKLDNLEIPIYGISYVYDISFDTEKIKIEGERLAKAIVQDVAQGDIKFFDTKGRAHNVRSAK